MQVAFPNVRLLTNQGTLQKRCTSVNFLAFLIVPWLVKRRTLGKATCMVNGNYLHYFCSFSGNRKLSQQFIMWKARSPSHPVVESECTGPDGPTQDLIVNKLYSVLNTLFNFFFFF